MSAPKPIAGVSDFRFQGRRCCVNCGERWQDRLTGAAPGTSPTQSMYCCTRALRPYRRLATAGGRCYCGSSSVGKRGWLLFDASQLQSLTNSATSQPRSSGSTSSSLSLQPPRAAARAGTSRPFKGAGGATHTMLPPPAAANLVAAASTFLGGSGGTTTAPEISTAAYRAAAVRHISCTAALPPTSCWWRPPPARGKPSRTSGAPVEPRRPRCGHLPLLKRPLPRRCT